MMSTIRIIPRLDIKGPNLVKGIHLEGLRVLGKPEQFARAYYEQGADELLYVDLVASLYNRNSILPVIERTARDIFIPLTVAGGIRTVEDIRAALRAGADKVALNTAAVRDPDIIREAAMRFGSSTIVVSIEAIQQRDGEAHAFTDNGREPTGLEVVAWARRAAELGAGEILLVSVDREGTGQGFDVELTSRVAAAVSIPVIACGGAGALSHITDVIRDGDVRAVALSSMLHYDFIEHHPLSGEYADEGNIEYMQQQKRSVRCATASLSAIKTYVHSSGIPCRPTTRE